MTEIMEFLLAVFLIIDIWLAAASRLRHCIRLASYQGVLLGLLPLAAWPWTQGAPHFELFFVAAVNILVKGWLLPLLLNLAMTRANVRRELEPLVGYSASIAIIVGGAWAAFLFCAKFKIAPDYAPVLSAPVAFTTIMTGLFIIITRRKAITQVIGFLVFENGIAIFGIGMMLEYGLIVELGILLDVIVLVFVMGIAVFHISREFSHIDSDRLNQLGDWSEPEQEQDSERSFLR